MWSYSLSKYIDSVKNVLSQPDGADKNLEVSLSLSSGYERLHGSSYHPLVRDTTI